MLKTLGATRGHIASVFSVEFAVLGLLSGAAGVLFAEILSRILLHLTEVPFVAGRLALGSAIVVTVLLAVGTGWIASFRILGQKPLEVLREE